MRTTIDNGGRIVVPKKYRDFLGLVPGSEVEIDLDGDVVRVAPADQPTRLEERDGVLVAITDGEALTADDVRDLLEAVRAERA